MTSAVVALIERDDRILTVWNRTFGAWTLPGGKVETYDDSAEDALQRELMEETGLVAHGMAFIFRDVADPHPKGLVITRVAAYRVAVRDDADPKPLERGSAIRWMTASEFLAQTPFPVWTERMYKEAKIQEAT